MRKEICLYSSLQHKETMDLGNIVANSRSKSNVESAPSRVPIMLHTPRDLKQASSTGPLS